MQAMLKKAGKTTALGSLDENDPDAADDDKEEGEGEVEGAEATQASLGDAVVDKLTDLLGKTGLTAFPR